MSSVNKVIILGHLGRDPEMRYTPNGTAVANFSLATSRSWKNKDTGERQEETEWHRLTAFDRLAEIIGEYLKKGSQAYFEGRLKTRKWTDKEGVEKYTTEIVVESMTMLGKGDGASSSGSSGAAAPRAAPRQTPSPAAKSGTGFDEMEDDIPY